MRIKIFEVAPLVLCFLLFFNKTVGATWVATEPPQVGPGFELQTGDRVVFLGNSLFENDTEFGYIEYALSTRWPNRGLTFRNFGWSGDTVFAEARGYYTNPPGPYELLIRQIKEERPSVVFVAYGAIESEAGEAGVRDFKKGLNQLLDSIQDMGARAVLLSPLPALIPDSTAQWVQKNKNLTLYSTVLSETAAERDLLFVDIMTPYKEIQGLYPISDDGVRLNEVGYFHLASVLEQGLGLPPRDWKINIGLSDKEVQANVPAGILEADAKKGALRFMVKDEMLPFPFPSSTVKYGENGRKLKITGLKKGFYTLSVDGTELTTASSGRWEEGVEIRQGPAFTLAEQLSELIVKKNELFFQKYRPPNRTYLLGFRSYEQGKHVRELEDLGLIINWLEGQIKAFQIPGSMVYSLTPAL